MKTTILKNLTLATLLLASHAVLSADKLAPGSDVKMLNLLPGKIYKFDVPGFADDGVYTVSIPWFSGNGIDLPPTLSSEKYGILTVSVNETKDALKNVCSGNLGSNNIEVWQPITIDGFSSCYIFGSSFSATTTPDYTSYNIDSSLKPNSLSHQYNLILHLQVALDNSSVLSTHFQMTLDAKKTIPNTVYDFSNQLPVFLANKGVVPEKNLREFAKQEMLKIFNNIGITKVK